MREVYSDDERMLETCQCKKSVVGLFSWQFQVFATMFLPLRQLFIHFVLTLKARKLFHVDAVCEMSFQNPVSFQ